MIVSPLASVASAQERVGGIRGVVYDADFDAPLPLAAVRNLETKEVVETSELGSYVFREVPAGTYTLVFSKPGYVQQVVTDVVVEAGRMTEVDARLGGEFVEMEEFVVQDELGIGAGTEAALLITRLESPALMDSISADLMSRAGASDAAGALRLVSGATLADGKSAVIRGLPDRYVSSQMNGVRLPSADAEKRAVELDQFPAPVIESVQVTKTFTPDQQGDASGGAVDVRLKGIPEGAELEIRTQLSVNTNARGSDFLTYEGGGVGVFGLDDGGRDIQYGNLGASWDGAVGVSRDDAPIDFKWGVSTGGKHELDGGALIGGFASVFYERDSSFHDDGIDDSLWVQSPGGPMTPEVTQGTPPDDFNTSLLDITKGTQSVLWGGLGTLGLETDDHELGLAILYTHAADDTAILAEDTRGKQFFFPGYDPDDPSSPGYDERDAAPYIRTETLEYTERTTGTFQLSGEHRLSDFSLFREPELRWRASTSFSDLYQPDKRQFASEWLNELELFPGFVLPGGHFPFKPAANFNLGNLQRTWRDIQEDSLQLAVDLELPFEQWGGEEAYAKVGVFDDSVDRSFDQDSFSNFGDSSSFFAGDFDDFWSSAFPFEDHPITASLTDVDYEGELDVSALYAMVDLPLSERVKVITGARLETTDIGIILDPEENVFWYPPGEPTQTDLNPGDADVDFSQNDVLPAIALQYSPTDQVTLRASYAQTIARQTFRELTPVIQEEFAGGPVFIGNPFLEMSALRNFDLRADYRPYDGALVSLSYFYKDIEDAIELVQRVIDFGFTTPVNYPDGELSGVELELRQDLGHYWDAWDGFGIGANATFISSEVTLPDDEQTDFADAGYSITSRDLVNAPEYLYNLYVTYENERNGVRAGLFYTVTGDTLVAGAGLSDNNLVPDVYARQFGNLNFSISKAFGDHVELKFQAKNITNPDIKEVYRTDLSSDGDVTNTSFSRGREFSIGLTYSP